MTWNLNGTLQQLAITDPFNPSDAQTCTYNYDPQVRVASANCGSVWSQTFTYDFAGNIKKSGSLSFQPIYLDGSGKTSNQYYSGLTGLKYDPDGNLLNDSFHTYTWDAFGGVTAIDSYPITHDAFGRIVEFKSSPTYQIVYAPTGADVAVMNGQTIFYGKVPLPGGGRAVFTSSGLNDYTHVDWQGSARFGSTTSRGMLFDMAYAPYGEIYAKTGGGSAEAFTGQYRDIVGDEWDFQYRQEHSSQGRWISPDPAGLAAVDPMNPQTWNRYAYVGGNPLANVDPDGLVTLPGCEEGDWGCGIGVGGWGCGALGGPEGDLCTLMLPGPSVLGGGGGGSGSGGSGDGGTSAGSGGGTNGSGGSGGRIANFPNGETNGIPNGMSLNWGGIWGALLPIDPSCEFGACVPIASGYATSVSGNGTPGSPFTISVYVWAGLHLCGDFWCDQHGNSIGTAPPEIQGIHPTNVEFDLLLSGFYISRINSNPLLRIGPGYKEGGRKIFRIVTGGPGLWWWKHIWDGPPWPW